MTSAQDLVSFKRFISTTQHGERLDYSPLSSRYQINQSAKNICEDGSSLVKDDNCRMNVSSICQKSKAATQSSATETGVKPFNKSVSGHPLVTLEKIYEDEQNSSSCVENNLNCSNLALVASPPTTAAFRKFLRDGEPLTSSKSKFDLKATPILEKTLTDEGTEKQTNNCIEFIDALSETGIQD